MLGNYVIGLREGVEAALIVSILLGYLDRSGRKHLRTYVMRGVVAAVLVSVAIAAGLQAVSSELSEAIEPVFAGAMSLLAVSFVTWMIFWMKRTARTISADLRSKLDRASVGGGIAVAAVAFAAVAREGAETAIFFWAAAHATGQELAALTGLLLGLATAVVIGWMVLRSTRRVDMHRLFKVTGIALVFIAAGVLSYGIAEWQEVGLLPGHDAVVLDLTAWLPEGSIASILAAGLLNLGAVTTALQVTAYAAYAVVVLYLILRPRSAASDPAAQARETVGAPGA